jgi:hypothetical protein
MEYEMNDNFNNRGDFADSDDEENQSDDHENLYE